MVLNSGQTLPASTLETRIAALEKSAVQARDTSSTSGTTTSNSYTSTLSGLVALSTTFVVPPSGKVFVTVEAMCSNSSASGPWDIFCSFQITGTGFTTYGANDYDAASARNAGPNIGGTSSRRTLLTGLPAGSTLTVTMVYKVTGGTGLFNARCILIEPAQ